MATFHVKGKVDLTMLVGDEKFVQVMKKMPLCNVWLFVGFGSCFQGCCVQRQ
jgi:hypothetical protein